MLIWSGGGWTRWRSMGFLVGNGVRCVRRTTRGLCRRRRVVSRSRSSAVMARTARRSREGGKSRLVADLAAGGAQRAGEGHLVGVDARGAGAGMDQVADRVVEQEDAPDLLLDAVGVAGAQHRAGVELVGLDLVEHRLDLPALRVRRGEVFGAGGGGVIDGGDQPIH